MTREGLIQSISQPPPPLRIGKRLSVMLARKEREEIPCENPDCFNFHLNKKFCSDACRVQILQSKGSKAIAGKRRGCNPRKHISIRVDGRMKLYHRHLVETERGQSLESDEIVHHRDERKHHNCYGSQLCETCFLRGLAFLRGELGAAYLYSRYGFSNLEVLTGDAAVTHIRYHQRQMQRARRKKR